MAFDWWPWRCWVCQDSMGDERQNEVSVTPLQAAHQGMSPSSKVAWDLSPTADTAGGPRVDNGMPVDGRPLPSGGPQMSPRDPERARLREVMKSFVNRGQQGVPIELVDETLGSVKRGTYHIDERLQKIILKEEGADPPGIGGCTGDNECLPDGSGRSSAHVVMLSRLIDVLRPEDGDTSFPPGAMMELSEDQKKRLVMVQYSTEAQDKCQVLFLEATPVDRQRFLMCVRILRRYMEEQR
eukprot:gnl/TRDRNA2_/TRDRNA2_194241_c0_seq1.p1 gnl/TRDRNA2_/TRDRNA2_194241_c0~~gnl/TRDRNA2_/TRDRNA2_194241_c0_seq1.p1  ORF type:complete len:240 (+),score=39.66 gnl/TRDRNA2_/TRDRNA2_194241_c0_seq1:87-806(+)